MHTLGIVTHSAEGGALCFTESCRYGGARLGDFLHPTIVLSAVPMGLSVRGWETGNNVEVARHLLRGIELVADAGADFFVCPDNTAHIVLEELAPSFPLPGLHIADIACAEIQQRGWSRAGLLGTKWTMTGPVYPKRLEARGVEVLIPEEPSRRIINNAIFDELCHGVITDEANRLFLAVIEELASRGADCVILGCTEIPLLVAPENSPLPTVDSTRLLARAAVDAAIREEPIASNRGWLTISD